ncbi:MAG: Na/Pi symporter [Candidatus Hydrogenedentes bacterium]|nr:Na/Pi symporter [Candidatus Hydrogenedentota bacterium]
MLTRGQMPRCVASCVVLSLSIVLFAGCGPRQPVPADTIAPDPHASGDNQCGMHGQVLAKPIRVVVQGPRVPGLLGGKGSRHPVAGCRVTFTIQDADSGAVFPASEATSLVVTTDAAGLASADVRVGHRSGDVNITASVDTAKGAKSVNFRVLAGVELIGADLEGPTGGEVDELGLRLQNRDGSPAAGVDVYFRVEGDGHGATVGDNALVRVVTDADGRAVTSWTLGSRVQQYFVSAEIRDLRPGVPEPERFHARAIEYVAMAIDKRAMVLQLIGGLAIFILGMKWMSAGLRRMADRRLKAILQAMTRNRLTSVGVGAGLTAMVQSSSATTVMTVGFVNAGLLTLTQAIGVVYGANIGTTITAQIIAFKLDVLAYPAIATGLILTAVGRRAWLKALGEAILGFGLLFLGMTTMSDILKPLRHSPEFVSLFKLFDCTPVAGGLVRPGPALMCIFIGTVATCVVQSSSATVGLVLALSGQGLLSFYTAVPLVLGDNIGTTITAVLASLGANRNAKRAAVAHTLFNLFGAAYMYLFLFLPVWDGQPLFLGFIDFITPGDVFASMPENLPRHVANAHTAFNLLNCVFFLPFIPLMTRVCERLVPLTDADRESVLQYLEPRLLDTPTLALQQAVREVSYMLRRAQKSIQDGCLFFREGGRALEEKIASRENIIDRLQQEISTYLVELSQHELAPDESALIPPLIHVVNDAERIGDHSENLVELGHLSRERNRLLSDTALNDIARLQVMLDSQFDCVHRIFERPVPELSRRAEDNETAIHELVGAATDTHVRRLEAGDCDVQAGVIFLDLLAHLERVGDHLINIAERAEMIGNVIALR